MYDNFLFRAKRTVYKWWCIVYKPVYKLIHSGEWPEEKEPDVKYAAPTKPSQSETLDAQALADAVLDTNSIISTIWFRRQHICLPNQRHPHRLSMQNQT